MQRRIVIATGAAAALALALAAPAGAATVKGTVVHKDKRHHRFVVAQRAAATAVTPTPLAQWAAQGVPGRPATGAAERLAELAAGAAGSASAAGMAIKAGAVIAVTGAVAAGLGGGAARDHVRTPGGPASGAPSLSRATRSPRAAPGPPRRAESLTCDLPETPARPDGSCAGPRATAQATRASPLRGAGAAAERTTRIRGTPARTGDGPADGTTAAGGTGPTSGSMPHRPPRAVEAETRGREARHRDPARALRAAATAPVAARDPAGARRTPPASRTPIPRARATLAAASTPRPRPSRRTR